MNDLSLGDVARLARVERPVVTMWTKRPKAGVRFPELNADGRVDAGDLVDWLEATGRGNNPDARAEVALHAVISPGAPLDELWAVLVLLTVRAIIGDPLSALDRDGLLDRVEEVDPDDDWLLDETEQLWRPELAARADAVADAAWNDAAAYETLRKQYLVRTSASGPDRSLVRLLAAAVRAMLGEGGQLVDVQGSCSDVVVELAADEDHEMPGLLLVTDGDGPVREVRRRLTVQGIRPRLARLDDDWAPARGSVMMIRLPDASPAGLHLLEEASLQLGEDVNLLAVGPSALLVDPLSGQAEVIRDELLRSGTVRAVVRLPAGTFNAGGRGRGSLWLMSGGAQRDHRGAVRVGDLSGRRLDDTVQRDLLDDLLAAAGAPGTRVFSVLRSVTQAALVAEPGPLVASGHVRVPAIGAAPVQDAARMQQLYDALTQVLPPYEGGFTAVVADTGRMRTERISLGAALDRGAGGAILKLLKGHRLPSLDAGGLARWTAADIVNGVPSSIDRLALTAAVPGYEPTEPGDIVFTVSPAPAAVVDRRGGAVVASPARVLRVLDPQRMSPSAIAAVINARGPRDRVWRDWLVPMRVVGAEDPEEFLAHLEGWQGLLEQWRAQINELRTLVVGSTLSGAVAITTGTNDEEGD